MIDALRSLPLGVFWYPAVIVLLIVAARALVSLRATRGRRVAPTRAPGSAFARYLSMVERAADDPRARVELERVCIGFLMLAEGRNGYSRGECRDYLASSPPEARARIVSEHLNEQSATLGDDDRGYDPRSQRDRGYDPRSGRDRWSGLPDLCGRAVLATEEILEGDIER